MYRALVTFVAVTALAAPAWAQMGTPTLERSGSSVLDGRSIAGSYCATADPYLPGGTANQCWTCYSNGPTTNPECLSQVALGFPDGWTVACDTQDAADSAANPVSFACGASGQTVTYSDTDGGSGEICPTQSWSFCVDVTAPAASTEPRCVFYTLTGDGAGGAPHQIIDCETVSPAQGSVTILKSTFPEDSGGQVFAFTGDLGTFSLAGGGSTTITGLAPGAYDVAETLADGWLLTQISCVDPDGGTTFDLASATATIDVDDGEEVTCTFVNTAQGSVTVAKQTVPEDSAGQLFTFAGDLGAFSLAGGGTTTIAGLTPGSYDVAETLPAGWGLTEITCVDPDGGTVVNLATATATIDVDPGEQVACTFLNTEQQEETGSVTIAKQTIPADSGGQLFTFAGDLGAFSLTGGGDTTIADLEAGSYVVSETLPAGWGLTEITCVDPDGGTVVNLAAATATIDVDPGEQVTCTFLNTEQQEETGSVTIAKQTTPADSGGQLFTFAGDLGAFSLTGGGSTTLPDLEPGSYVVSETLPAGWLLTQITCVDPDGGTAVNLATSTATIDVDAGESITCTFLNSAQEETGSVTIAKQTTPADSGGQLFTFAGDLGAFTLTGGGDTTIADLEAGSYVVSETLPAGWGLTQITCVDPDGGTVVNLAAAAATIDVDPGEQVTCTFVNEAVALEPSVTIAKMAFPQDSGQLFSFSGDLGDFSLSGDDSTTITGLEPGTYQVTEALLEGWTLNRILCEDPDGGSSFNLGTGTAIIDLDDGEQISCTFYNESDDYVAPTPIPTLSTWMLLLLVGLVSVTGILVIRGRVG